MSFDILRCVLKFKSNVNCKYYFVCICVHTCAVFVCVRECRVYSFFTTFNMSLVQPILFCSVYIFDVTHTKAGHCFSQEKYFVGGGGTAKLFPLKGTFLTMVLMTEQLLALSQSDF